MTQLIEDFHTVHEEVFALTRLDAGDRRLAGAGLSSAVQDDQGLELAPSSEIDIEDTRAMYVGSEGWSRGGRGLRVTEVRGPAVLELPAQHRLTHRRDRNSQCQRDDRDHPSHVHGRDRRGRTGDPCRLRAGSPT